jgi:CheY-like chemotaxis protein
MNNQKEKVTSLSGRKKILIVDDDRKGTPYLVEELSNIYLYHVTWVDQADEVLNLLENSNFDAIILDIMMPPPKAWNEDEKRRSEYGLSTGNVLFSNIREINQTIPVLIYSAKTTSGIKESTHVKVLTKPEFISKINETLLKLISHEN